MTQHVADLITEDILCPGGMPAFLAMPRGSGPFPVIVLMHERYGLVQHTRDLAMRCARDGFQGGALAIAHRAVCGFRVKPARAALGGRDRGRAVIRGKRKPQRGGGQVERGQRGAQPRRRKGLGGALVGSAPRAVDEPIAERGAREATTL